MRGEREQLVQKREQTLLATSGPVRSVALEQRRLFACTCDDDPCCLYKLSLSFAKKRLCPELACPFVRAEVQGHLRAGAAAGAATRVLVAVVVAV